MGRFRRPLPYNNVQVSLFSGLINLGLLRIVGLGSYEQSFRNVNKSVKRRQKRRKRGTGNKNHINVAGVSSGKVTRQRQRRVIKARDVDLSAEILNELKTDPKHYKVMRKRWQNLGIPNPAKNLTSLNLAGEYVELHKEPNYDKIHHCTKFHDQKIDKLNIELKRTMAELQEKEYTEIMSNVKKYADDLKSISAAGSISFSDIEKVLPLFESSVTKFQATVSRFSLEKKALEEKILPQIEKIKAAKDEISTFNSYYEREGSNGLNTMYMTEAEYNSLYDTDKWFAKMKEFYKS